MTQQNNPATMVTTAGQVIVMERVFHAPRELVFEMWSNPEHLKHWWGPQEWTLPVCNMDFRPGGTWHFCMKGPDGEEAWGKAVFREIVKPERIVYSDFFSDAEGNYVNDGHASLMTVEFTEQEGQTRITARARFASEAALEASVKMGMVEGFSESWDRLHEYVSSTR